MAEVDLARHVIAWLREQRWEVFQEVSVTSGGSVADIVVKQGPLLGVVECKVTLGVAVLGQCHAWRRMANYVWAATPWRPNSKSFALVIAREYGIGLLSARELKDRTGPVVVVSESLRPTLRRRIDPRLGNAIRPQHASGIYAQAGSVGGNRYTPFAETCRALRGAVAHQPGLSLKDAIDSIAHHYNSTASARSALAKWIRDGVVDGVEGRIEQRKLRLYPRNATT